MDFLNRREELSRLESISFRPEGGFAVLWGRRRVGKTRLLLEWVRRRSGIYFVADQSAESLQRRALAETLSVRLPGFNDVVYPNWGSLLARMATESIRVGWRGPFVLDEFPYLVQAAPELPSVLQRWLDHDARRAHLTTAVSGSSQRMMQGLILDRSAPLFGRAVEAFPLDPLAPGYLLKAFPRLTAPEAVAYHAVWGGIPRYWELAQGIRARSLDDVVDALVLDPRGPLHQEPDRLLQEESPPAMSLRPLLEVIGMGANRLMEMGARLGSPLTSLSHPIARLQEMGLIVKENPFGESERNGKRSLYRIADPFFRMWYRIVGPRRTFLVGATPDGRKALWRSHRSALEGTAWEELCRTAAPRMVKAPWSRHGPWRPAARWWRGDGPEWDLVSLSLDGRHLLLGEVKSRSIGITDTLFLRRTTEAFLAKGLPPVVERKTVTVHRALFLPHPLRLAAAKFSGDISLINAADVFSALK